ncbi:MAG: thiamine phosphate synthase [Nannocystaceae bacterium]|nr:thiamine phosphate synthase [bacterium]
MIPRLLVITPPMGPVPRTVVDVALEHGIDLAVLLREPAGDPLEPRGRLETLRRAAVDAGLPVLLSCAAAELDRVVGPAADAGLCGLQLKGDPSEEALLRARAAWPEAIVGASVHGEPRAVAADYLVFAPVFAPRTASAWRKQAAGVAALGAWARWGRVFALGGVEPDNAAACVAAGAYGLAAISSFLGSAEALAHTVRAFARALTLRPDVPPQTRG